MTSKHVVPTIRYRAQGSSRCSRDGCQEEIKTGEWVLLVEPSRQLFCCPECIDLQFEDCLDDEAPRDG